jgi:hypothetical protein
MIHYSAYKINIAFMNNPKLIKLTSPGDGNSMRYSCPTSSYITFSSAKAK